MSILFLFDVFVHLSSCTGLIASFIEIYSGSAPFHLLKLFSFVCMLHETIEINLTRNRYAILLCLQRLLSLVGSR